MTLSELRAQVRFAVKRQTTGLTDAQLTAFINWSIEDICLARDWSEMFKEYSGTLVASTSRHSFPTRLKNIYDLRLNTSNGRKLILIDPRKFDVDYPKPSLLGTTSDPAHYADYGTWFEIIPQLSANTTAYIKCTIRAATLSSDASSPDITNKDRLIVYQAITYAFDELQEWDLSNAFQKKALDAFRIAVEGDRKPLDWTPYARPFAERTSPSRGQTWANPFVSGRSE